MEDGTYFYKIEAKDDSSNSESTEKRKITIDTTPPLIIASINDTSVEFSMESVLINWSSIDKHLETVHVYAVSPNNLVMDDTYSANDSFIFTPANLTELGPYRVNFYANDTPFANKNNFSLGFNVVDTIPPAINLSIYDEKTNLIVNKLDSINLNLNLTTIEAKELSSSLKKQNNRINDLLKKNKTQETIIKNLKRRLEEIERKTK